MAGKDINLVDPLLSNDPVAPVVTPRDVGYIELDVPYNAIPHRCGYLMENHMQCPTHATFALIDDVVNLTDDTEFLCAYHFNTIAIFKSIKFVKNPPPTAA